VDKQIRRMVKRKSLENIARVNKILNNMYINHDEISEFSEVFKAYRYVNITVEAINGNCSGKIICMTEPL